MEVEMTGSLVEGKVAVVTGAASGIGRATALLLAEEGAGAVVVGDLDRDGADTTAHAIEQMGVASVAVALDVSHSEEVDAFIAMALSQFGRLDCAVNSAGTEGPLRPIEECADEEWHRVISVNLDGIFYSMRAEVRAMLEHNGGSIVNIGSAVAVDPIPNMGSYNASKAGVNGLTRSAAGENVRRNIRINAVLPSGIRTGMMEKHASTAEGRSTIESRLAMGRMAEPKELAESVVWLCSSRAGWVTGLTMLVDGGSHAFRP
jgi:NAD(P)-dependent dehydrogenase (short-subunit alcohol dehydrogenase family)